MKTLARGSWRGLRWIVASVASIVAVFAIVVFALTRLGYINPLVVISGSMEPGISKGDLLIDVRVPVEELQVGQVVSATPDADHMPVSHRIVDIQRDGDTALLQLKGDANTSVDAPVYQVSGTAWVPKWRVPWAGCVITKLIKPSVMYPLAIAIAALIVLTLVPGPTRRRGEPARHKLPKPTLAKLGLSGSKA